MSSCHEEWGQQEQKSRLPIRLFLSDTEGGRAARLVLKAHVDPEVQTPPQKLLL